MTDCWQWLGYTRPNGYGLTKDQQGKTVYSHREFYRLFIGEIPSGLTIDHLCKNKNCVNPDHMEPVTLRENILRSDGVTARKARQTHCKNGHAFTPGNIYRRRNGSRLCRRCTLDYQKAR